MDFKDKLTDKDIATVEVLHDYLIDEISFDSEIMVNSRELVKKLHLLLYIQEKNGL